MNSEREGKSFISRFWGFLVGIAAIIGCIAGVFVVPEVRTNLGLDVKAAFQEIYLVDQSNLYEIEKYNLGLEDGDRLLLGVPFDIGWKITTQCEDKPGYPQSIFIPVDLKYPVDAYLLIQAGWGLTIYSGKQIGRVTFDFENSQLLTTDLVLGDNIRDWSADDPNAVITSTSPFLQTAHKGIDPTSGKAGHIDMLTIPFPNGYEQAHLTSIVIEDTSESIVGSLSPCIHLLGITIKFRP
jgi:hypothetical protein